MSMNYSVTLLSAGAVYKFESARQPIIGTLKYGRFTDEELVIHIRQASGELRREILNELFGRYQERVARWCFRITGNRDAAADLAQEIFIRLQRHLDSFEGTAKFSTWVHAVARNHALNSIRGRSP